MAHSIHSEQIKLRMKLLKYSSVQFTSQMKKAFVAFTVGQKHKGLAHPLEDYNQCIQLVDIDKLKNMLSKDAAFLKTTIENAENSSEKHGMTDFLSKNRKIKMTKPTEEFKYANAISPCMAKSLKITKDWRPELTKLQVFGDASLPIEHEFPTL